MEHFAILVLALALMLALAYIVASKFYPKRIEALEDEAKALHAKAAATLASHEEHLAFLRNESVRLAGVRDRASNLVARLEALL